MIFFLQISSWWNEEVISWYNIFVLFGEATGKNCHKASGGEFDLNCLTFQFGGFIIQKQLGIALHQLVHHFCVNKREVYSATHNRSLTSFGTQYIRARTHPLWLNKTILNISDDSSAFHSCTLKYFSSVKQYKYKHNKM